MTRTFLRTRSKRALPVTAALLCFTLAFALTPSGVRSQAVAARAAVPAPTLAPHLPEPIDPNGDAFAARATIDDDTVPVALAAAALAIRPAIAAPPRVTAIATGDHPVAIVEAGGTAQAVASGDALDGSRVAAINGAGVRLANGTQLPLDPGTP
jgi:hypothetical protein